MICVSKQSLEKFHGWRGDCSRYAYSDVFDKLAEKNARRSNDQNGQYGHGRTGRRELAEAVQAIAC